METNNNKNLYIIVGVVVLVLLIVGGVYLSSMAKKPTTPIQNNSNNNYPGTQKEVVKSYALGGQVKEINENRISIDVQLSTTTNGQVVTTNEIKIAIVTKSTPVFITKYANKKYSKEPAKTSDIKVGDRLTLYSGSNISEMVSFVPSRVDINR